MILTAVLLTGLGYVILGWVNSYTTFLIVYLGIISFSFTPGFVHAPMAVGNTWFIRYRARAMTVISSAVPVGGTLADAAARRSRCKNGAGVGARFSAGLCFLIIGIPLGLGVRSSPESMGLLPDGAAPETTEPMTPPAIVPAAYAVDGDPTLREAMRTWIFWLFVVGMTVRVGAYSTISVHFVPIMVWKGMSQEGAALLLASFAFLNWAAHYVIGWFADTTNRPKLLAFCMLVAAASMLLLVLGRWRLAVVGFYHWVYRHRRVVSDRLGYHRRLLRPQILRHHSRHHVVFLHLGQRPRPGVAGAAYDRSQSYVATLYGLVAILYLAPCSRR